MSDLTATSSRAPSGPWAYAGFGLALVAAAIWFLAGVVDDGLYAMTGILGLAAFAAGLRGRREAARAGARTWPALVGIVLGGLLGGAVLGAFVYFVLSNAVS
jgi:hypothetical protein